MSGQFRHDGEDGLQKAGPFGKKARRGPVRRRKGCRALVLRRGVRIGDGPDGHPGRWFRNAFGKDLLCEGGKTVDLEELFW